MKFRSAQTLVYSRDGEALLGCNFLTNRVFECSVDVIAFLGELDDWQDIDEIAGRMPDMTSEEIRTIIDHLVAASAIVEQGSALAKTEQEFQSGWRWGVPAAMMHFCSAGSRPHDAGRIRGAAAAQGGRPPPSGTLSAQ